MLTGSQKDRQADSQADRQTDRQYQYLLLDKIEEVKEFHGI